MPELILASGSVYRRALLERLGTPFRVREPLVDEEALKVESDALAPRALAEFLARVKTESVAAVERAAVVVGGDQVVVSDGRVLGKPWNATTAVEQLLTLSGRRFALITAMVVCHPLGQVEHTDTTTLRMRPLTRPEAERYVAADRPLDCAGSFKIEARGITLFDRIETEDSTAITGLPLIALTTILRQLGFALP